MNTDILLYLLISHDNHGDSGKVALQYRNVPDRNHGTATLPFPPGAVLQKSFQIVRTYVCVCVSPVAQACPRGHGA